MDIYYVGWRNNNTNFIRSFDNKEDRDNFTDDAFHMNNSCVHTWEHHLEENQIEKETKKMDIAEIVKNALEAMIDEDIIEEAVCDIIEECVDIKDMLASNQRLRNAVFDEISSQIDEIVEGYI